VGFLIGRREEVMKKIIIVLIVSFFCIAPKISKSCTTFCIDEGRYLVLGKNFGWIQNDGLLFVNKRGVLKTAKSGEEVCTPATWTSKFGSVTFNQIGRDLPWGGINEAGLVVEILALYEAKFPPPDERPCIGPGQWIQYQLDNCNSVEEVIASDSSLRIINPPLGLGCHYFVCDKTGNCASIAFLNGKLVYHTKKTMPVKALTNSNYSESIAFLQDEQTGKSPDGQGNISLFRFVRAAEMIEKYKPKKSSSAVDYAFDIISNVNANGIGYMFGKPLYTQWSIVYDLKNLKVYFHTRGNEQIRYFTLSAFDFSCKTPVTILDINANLSGDVANNFVNYTHKANRDLQEQLIFLTKEVIDDLADCPENSICTNR
jgi:choloylglycine hydrolase